MRIELREPEPAGPPIDWMAEFIDEEKQDLPLLLGLDDDDDDDEVEKAPEGRLIPLPTAEPAAYWEPTPHRPLPPYKTLHKGLSMPALVLVGIAMIASLIGAAVLWSQTTQAVDQTVLLSRAPAPSPSPIEPATPPPATKLIRPPDASVPQVAGFGVSPKSPVSAKPQPSAAPAAGRETRTAPPRAAANSVPPLIQGVIDRERLEASTPAPATPAPAPTPTPTPASLVIASSPATLTAAPPVTTLGTPPAAKPVADTATAPPPPPARDERAINTAAIQTVLDRYRQAFSTLSTDGLATVWRSVDTRALARAFDQLEKQTVEFDSCRIEIVGVMADAVCRGRTSFVPKIGARTPRVESRQWSFRLVNVRSGWVIDRVESR